MLLSEECAKEVERWKLEMERREQDFHELSKHCNWKMPNFIRACGEDPPMPNCLRAAINDTAEKKDVPSEFTVDAQNAAGIPVRDPQEPPGTTITDPPAPQEEDNLDQSTMTLIWFKSQTMRRSKKVTIPKDGSKRLPGSESQGVTVYVTIYSPLRGESSTQLEGNPNHLPQGATSPFMGSLLIIVADQ